MSQMKTKLRRTCKILEVLISTSNHDTKYNLNVHDTFDCITP